MEDHLPEIVLGAVGFGPIFPELSLERADHPGGPVAGHHLLEPGLQDSSVRSPVRSVEGDLPQRQLGRHRRFPALGIAQHQGHQGEDTVGKAKFLLEVLGVVEAGAARFREHHRSNSAGFRGDAHGVGGDAAVHDRQRVLHQGLVGKFIDHQAHPVYVSQHDHRLVGFEGDALAKGLLPAVGVERAERPGLEVDGAGSEPPRLQDRGQDVRLDFPGRKIAHRPPVQHSLQGLIAGKALR